MLRSRMADRVGKVPGWKPEVAAEAAGRFESCAIRRGVVAEWLKALAPKASTHNCVAGSNPAGTARGQLPNR
jgi:hypothetical protein